MKYRKIAAAMIILLGVTALLSGVLLILHAEHCCHPAVCPICVALARSEETFLCTAAMLAAVGLYRSLCRLFGYAMTENRIIPDWTLVRLKVKLLN